MNTEQSRLVDDIALIETLRIAVPLRIIELVSLPPSERDPRARGWQADGARTVGTHGDALQFRSVKRPSVAFNALARALAAAAVLYGQARFADLTWTPPPRSCWATETVQLRPAQPAARPVVDVQLPERAA